MARINPIQKIKPNTMTNITETRVYLIDLNNDISGVDIGDWNNLTDEQWIDISEIQGYILSLDGFQRAYNKEEIPCETYLRFITIPIN